MQSVSWPAFGFYLLLCLFVFYQQLHLKNFRGDSEAFRTALTLSALAGALTGLAYLVYYGWTVSWWPPVVFFVVGLLLIGIIGAVAERLVSAVSISVAGFVGWPVCAFFMFRYLPYS